MTYATTSIHGRCTAQATFASPLGALLLARTEHGLAGAWFEGQKHHPGHIAAPERPGDPLLAAAAAYLAGYFAAEPGNVVAAFDGPLDLQGTLFEREVWAELLRLRPGQTCSYGTLAARLGRPAASRAVGGAVGRNPVSIIVPCHRVVGRSGALTGYAGGIERKTALLRHEQACDIAEAALS